MKSRTILVVDDNPMVLKGVRVTLESEGYNVLTSPDGQTALDMMRTQVPGLILLDLLLPDIHGFELVKELRSLPEGKDLPIIAFSAVLDKLDHARAFQEGFTDYLFKPVEPAHLLQTIESYLPNPNEHYNVGRARRVLLVDDNITQRKLIKLRLEQRGFLVSAADDGYQALEQALNTPPDIILSDIQMPKMDGFRLCRAVRNDPKLADLPVVLVTSVYIEEQDRQLAMRMGADAFVIRTPDYAPLVQTLTRVLDGERGPRPYSTTQMPVEYTQRVIRQLELQLASKESLAQRLAWQEAGSVTLSSLAHAIESGTSIEAAMETMLLKCIDISGANNAIVYLVDSQGALSLTTHVGFHTARLEQLQSFFGHMSLLADVLEKREPMLLPSTDIRGAQVTGWLHDIGARWTLITPILIGEERVGAIVLEVAGTGLSEDYLAFARALGTQSGQAIALARAVRRNWEGEERLAGIFETNADAVLVLDIEGRITRANRAAKELLGVNDAEIKKGSFNYSKWKPRTLEGDLVPPEEMGFAQVMRTGKPVYRLERIYELEGSRSVIVSVNANVLKDSSGHANGAVISLQDITERKLAEDTLAASEKNLRALFAAMADVILVLDAQGRYLQIAPTNPDLLYRPPADLLGRTVHEVMPVDHADKILHNIQLALQKQEPVHIDYSLEFGGKEVWFEGTISPMEGNKVFWIARDITERKQAEAKLARSETQLAEAQAIARMGNWEWDMITNSSSWSDELYRMYGLEPGEIESTFENYLGLVHPDDRKQIQNVVANAIQEKVTFRHESRIVRADGTAGIFETTGRVIVDDTGNPVRVVGTAQDVTERRAAEEQIRFQAQIIDDVQAGIVTTNLEGEVTFWSRAAEHLVGWSMEETLGRKITDLFILPERQEVMAQLLIQVVSSLDMWQGEIPYLRKDGSSSVARVIITTLRNVQGQAVGLVGILVDISEQKRTEESLKGSEERAKSVFESVLDAIFIIDAEGRCVDINPAALDLVGATREDLIGKSALSLLPAPQLSESEMLDGLRVKRVLKGEHQIMRRDGTIREIEYNAQTRFLGDYSLVIARDITERKKAENEAHSSQERFAGILRSAMDAVISVDPEQRIMLFNPAAERMFGWSSDEVMGQPLDILIPERFRTAHRRHVDEFGETGLTTRAMGKLDTLSGLRKDNTVFPVEASISQVEVAGRNIYTVILRDVTERKKAEEARLAREAAEQANRAKSEFLSRMSHELRTPLNSILGFSQLLQMGDLTPKQSRNLDYVLKAGEHLLALINEVLDIARIESGHTGISLEAVEVGGTLRECLELIQPIAAQRNVRIDTGNILGQPWYVMADLQRLRQVLLNLMMNAVKYNTGGGSVSLSCEQRDDHLRILVSDTGPGISADNLSKLFTPFERLGADRTGIEGTGLGLTLSKHLVEAMNGAIGVESEVGHGSTFWVDMAVTESPINKQMEIFRTGPLLADSQMAAERTILYIEDNLPNIRLIEGILENLPNIKLLTAMQGTLALEIARRQSPDLILLDLHLPDLNGDEVLRRLKEDPQTRSIPVVMISADATSSQIERLRAAGAHEYLTKPLSIPAFLHILKEVFNEHG